MSRIDEIEKRWAEGDETEAFHALIRIARAAEEHVRARCAWLDSDVGWAEACDLANAQDATFDALAAAIGGEK